MADHSHYTCFDNPYLAVPSFRNMEGPVDPRTILGGDGRLELEIGFGRGRFIRERAMAQKDVRMLGIETKRKLVYECAERIQRSGIDNAVVMHGDAREVLARMVPDGCFDNIFILFPDPWWKARHRKRMVVTDGLTEHVVRLLRRGGHFFVETDVDFRADEYRQVLLAESRLTPSGDGGIVPDNPFGARSSREAQAMELGMPVYRLLFRRQ
jgi:tRNA (guanine-N7-)-methyltransferase